MFLLSSAYAYSCAAGTTQEEAYKNAIVVFVGRVLSTEKHRGVADKQLDSPYNTYKNKGLPPHPIANPGISAIEATLHPAETDCIYFLHDRDHVIHCSVTYEEHLEEHREIH